MYGLEPAAAMTAPAVLFAASGGRQALCLALQLGSRRVNKLSACIRQGILLLGWAASSTCCHQLCYDSEQPVLLTS